MSNRLVPAPYFPIPPGEYDQRYFNEVIRAFSVFLEQSRNPGEGRNTFTVFTDLATSDAGLEPGTVFNYGGYLKVATLNTPHAVSFSATSAVGSVTVTTT